MKKFILLLVLLLSLAANSFAQDKADFDQVKTVPAGQFWQREIVIKDQAKVRVVLKSKGPKSMMVLAERSYRALMAKNQTGFHKEDLIGGQEFEFEGGESKTELDIPKGNYWFIIQNQGQESDSIQLQLFELE